MNATGINLFIVDDNKLMVAELRNYLNHRFGNAVTVSSFYTGKSAVEKVDKNTDIVILDYHLDGENGNDVLKSIKRINPKTEVIMLSSNENMAIAVDAFRKGATDYIVKGDKSTKKLMSHIYMSITAPIRKMGKEFGVSKLIVIVAGVFIMMGIGVYLLLQLIHSNV